MIDDIKQETEERMGKALEALSHNFNKIRTGRAHPSLLDSIRIEYYGAETPLNQLANVNIEDARTLSVVAFDKAITPDIERAIMKSDLGLNPATAGEAGGVYLFEDAAALDAFLAGPLAAAVMAHPAVSDLVASQFEVLEDCTAITHGPIEHAQTA